MSVTVKQIVDAQAHIGTLKSEAHPKTRDFRVDVVNNIVVLKCFGGMWKKDVCWRNQRAKC